MTASSFDLVTLNCEEPRSLAVFWCAALDLVVGEDEDDGRWLMLADTKGVRCLGLQRTIDGSAEPTSRMHLDLRCPSAAFDAELTRLEILGARLLTAPRSEPYGRIANLVDPANHLFDLCAYHDIAPES